MRCGLIATGSQWDPVAGSWERGREGPGSIKDEKFIDQVSGCCLPKKDPAPWSKLF